MRYQSMIFPLLAVSLLAVACNNGEEPPIPRTVPPSVKSTITTIDAPAIKTPDAPSQPPVVMGKGPIYET